MLLSAMQRAAEKRIAGVVKRKRRRHYDHAALLAKACVVVGDTDKSEVWMEGLRVTYRRYPALQRELRSGL